MAEMTLEQQRALALAKARMRAAEADKTPAPKQSMFDNAKDTVVDTLAGVGSGVGKVGLGAQHYLGKFANVIGADTVGEWLVDDAAHGRAKLAKELAPHKARSPIAATGGDLTGSIAATLPVGGVLAKPIASKLPALANSMRTGGFSTGSNLAHASRGAKAVDMATRIGGGAATGGVAAGLVDPESAGTGALIGGMLPPGIRGAGELGKLAKKGASVAATHALGTSTGAGAESIRAAYHAGKNKSTAFLDNMRGKSSFNDVVDEAKVGLQNMRAERADAYRSGMVDISSDRTVIDFAPISDAVSRIRSMGSFKGQQINKNASGVVQDIQETVDNWASLNPAEYHTPEGLDALKQAIGDIRDTTQAGTAARRAADTAYNAVKDQITKQAPTYAKVMKDYSEASKTLKELEKSLSLGEKASQDTSIRKLQSLMRNNAQTNYGNRLDLAKALEDKGGVSLMPAIAGQTMNSALPRGMVGAIQKGGAGALALATPHNIPLLLGAAPFTSPRLVGEALYGLGRMNGATGAMVNAGKMTAEELAKKHPGLLGAPSVLYRSIPVLSTSTNR